MAIRGDRIRCTAIFKNAKEKDGKRQVPVMFSLNGRKIIAEDGEDHFFLDCDKPLYPFIGMDRTGSVFAKMLRDDEDKVTDKSRQMVSQALCTTFTSQGGDSGKLCIGQEIWNVYPDIRREGALLTCKLGYMWDICGAAYREQFSAEFPHFEVTILETGRAVGIGAVSEDYDMRSMPGWEIESVGYHTDEGKICHNHIHGEETEGTVKAGRGDRIRCTVMIGHEKENNGKIQVPVMFSLNGKKLITKEGADQVFMDFDKPLYPYIGMQGSIVFAKMLRDDKQALSTTSTSQDSDPGVLCVGQEMWKVHPDIQIEAPPFFCGAAYREQFSAEFPHFEMCPREVEDLDSKVRKSPEETNRKVNTSLEELVKEVEKKQRKLGRNKPEVRRACQRC
ncbi:hypothetical protein ACROYT_G040150 [Oculina patagonica]